MKPGDLIKLADRQAMIYGLGKIEELAVGRGVVWQFDYVQLLLLDGSFRQIRKKTGEYAVHEPAFEQLIMQHKQLEMLPMENACRPKVSLSVPSARQEQSTESDMKDQPVLDSPSLTTHVESAETSALPTVSLTGPIDKEGA